MQKRKETLIKKKQFMLQATFKNENGQPEPSQTKGKKSINDAIQNHPDLKNLIKVIKKIYRTIFYNEHPLATKQDQTIQRSTIQVGNNEENKEDVFNKTDRNFKISAMDERLLALVKKIEYELQERANKWKKTCASYDDLYKFAKLRQDTCRLLESIRSNQRMQTNKKKAEELN